MNSHIQLYQFVHDRNLVRIARITRAEVSPGPQASQEAVHLELQINETLWGALGDPVLKYILQRPANRTARLKFPDPVWGRVDLRAGVQVLLVTQAAVAPSSSPVYVEQIPKPDDPVLKSVREILEAERSPNAAAEGFRRHLHWLTVGTTVQKLFGGEALAKDAPASGRTGQLYSDFLKSFAGEEDEYVKISLGTWLWDDLYPAADQQSQLAILNATIEATSSRSRNVSSFALDRVSEADPELFRRPGIRTSPSLIRLLTERKEQETDETVRHHLDSIIAALRR